MRTLNQLIDLLKTVAQNHQQINSFGFGDPFEKESGTLLLGGQPMDDGRESHAPIYALLWANVISSVGQGSYRLVKFQLIVSDLVFKGESNENEVLSDLEMVAHDVEEMLRTATTADDYILDKTPITWTPFTEAGDDEVSGWASDAISIKIPYVCAIPKP